MKKVALKSLLMGAMVFAGLAVGQSAFADSSIPMYRMYNPYSGEHLYTRSTGERDNLKRVGWNYEGIAWNAPTSGEPVYRLYNRYNGEHFYTLNAKERDSITKQGWTYEGVAFYSYTGANGVPLTRLYNKRVNWHHYTLDENEKRVISKQGWNIEGIGWYAMPGSTANPVPAPNPSKPVTQKVLNAPVVYQGNTMLCEGASLLSGLKYKGVTNQDLFSFVNSMPRANDNNPYHGYSGEWRYNVNGTYQGIMPSPVVQWAKNVGGNAANITGCGANGIKNEIRKGNPVVAWVTYNYATPEFKQMPWGRAVWNGHVVLVDGFKDGAYHIVDPVFGIKWINSGTFERSFNTTGMAVAVR
ncbi:glycosyhydrolase [Enterococcus faecium]|nr:C39 family peptidase [Enterococcus sp. 3G1_DIV0629]OQO64438.1 glycosyhydrolase [Enterococcus faecium]OTO22022.1 hypothetical protein A5816_003068 [Enterococcus sp. 3G1_DIV0629]